MFNHIARAVLPRLLVCTSLLLFSPHGTWAETRIPHAPPASQLIQPPATLPGQSATLLPDGRWLLLGGGDVPAATGEFADRKTRTALAGRLHLGRSGHSTTLLPSGQIMVLGGTDARGNVLGSMELYDITAGRFQFQAEPGLTPRTGHSVTVLTDGRLLVAGGMDQRGQLIHDAEIYDPGTRQLERFNPRMDTARTKHVASLLPDANVILWGGTNQQGEQLASGELYEFARQRFQQPDAAPLEVLTRTPEAAQIPAISATSPVADAGRTPPSQPLMVHFAQQMLVTSLNDRTVTLIGPHGPVPVRVVPVELGSLLFVTPLEDLLPDSAYTLFISGASDLRGQSLPFTAIAFGTAALDERHRDKQHLQAAPSLVTPEVAAQSAPEKQAVEAVQRPAGPAQWQPGTANQNGDWRSALPDSPLQQLPALLAAGGLTALSGQVLALDGLGVKNVTLTLGTRSTQTDETGRFLLVLPNVATGVHVLSIDGSTAQRANASFGFYQTRVDVAAGRTSKLGYTIWLTAQDNAGDTSLPSPTAQEAHVTSPNIPGLELVIPPGTVIRGRDGKIITRINITPIPTDRTPFPIPQLDVPVYFTIQPGGAKLTTIQGEKLQGARLIYPNFGKAAPGTRIDFWNYDTQTKGWYVYGQGTVSMDGKRIVPDASVAIYEFTGAMVASPRAAPPEGPPPDGCNPGDGCNTDPNQPPSPPGCAGDPVDCATGLFLHHVTDLHVDDIVPLTVTRSYRPRDQRPRAFGIGTNLTYDYYLVGSISPYSWQDLVLPNGSRAHFVRTSPGTGFPDAVYEHKTSASIYFGATLRWHGGGSCRWELKRKDGTRMCFPDSMSSKNARRAAVVSWSDRHGNKLQFTRDSNSNLTRVASPGGRSLQFTYDSGNRIIAASDNLGRTVHYAYDTAGRLSQVTDAAGGIERYTYDANHNMLTVLDKRGQTLVSNVYDGNDRVVRQTYADGSGNQFAYTLAASGAVSQTDVTDERGTVTRMAFNAAGGLLSVTQAAGLPEQQTVTLERDPVTGLLLSQTDALGRKTAYTYDDKGNMLTRTALAGTADAVTTTMTYTADFSQLANITDALGHTWRMQHDSAGNQTATTDPNGNRIARGYNGGGQPTQAVDGLGNSTEFDYTGYDLSSITDPLRRVTSLYTDQVGRLTSVASPLGNRTLTAYDKLNRITSVTDALDGIASHGYDANSNRVTFTDPKGSTHRFGYDARNRVTSDTDPLGREEKYQYDAKGNLAQKTDRKGQVTRYAHDALDRLKKVTYADGTTVALSYDKGNRVTTMADSANGTLTFTYDSLDRVTRAESPKGSVSYTYYANGLRKSMTAPGMPVVTYSYDDGNRLTRIEQAAGVANGNVAQTIVFAYDAADRRIEIRYANGIVRRNTYDAASQLTAVTYHKPDGVLLGDLAYTYDNDGRRTSVSGTLAHAAFPAPVSPIESNAAHAATRFGAQALSYDQNGNLVNDGTQTYVWNARDQLVQIKDASGAEIARFTYDALGRRQSKTVRGASLGYVYDGANIVQELNGLAGNNGNAASVKAGYISGGIDEMFAQVAGGKVATYLTDALGSTIRLTDAAGGKLADYTYDPYGNTTADAVVDNPFQYTGRENDGTGLYYYRARYYAPRLGKFVSRDPIGLDGGSALYRYVSNNPISFSDPLGLQVWQQNPSLPPRVVEHNRYSNAEAQLRRESNNNSSNPNGPLPGIPRSSDTKCHLACPSDTPYSCPAKQPIGIGMPSSSGEQCIQVCVSGPFAEPVGGTSSPTSAAQQPRSATATDWLRLGRIISPR
jgi:RHS repeat-associated protein